MKKLFMALEVMIMNLAPLTNCSNVNNSNELKFYGAGNLMIVNLRGQE